MCQAWRSAGCDDAGATETYCKRAGGDSARLLSLGGVGRWAPSLGPRRHAGEHAVLPDKSVKQ